MGCSLGGLSFKISQVLSISTLEVVNMGFAQALIAPLVDRGIGPGVV